VANIPITGVFNYMKSRFNTDGNGSLRFEEDFINAVNMATRRINRDADLATRISMVADSGDEIELSDEYFDVVCELTAYYLQGMGQRPARGDEATLPKEEDIKFMVNSIRRDITTRAIAADTNDESDFVGLGGLGA
jgi:hypothetical protein